MRFTKMHGIGNDYIYFDCTRETLKDPAATALRLSDRHFGVGGDGIVLILPSDRADFRMRMFNADGSEGKMCGNAIRCVGKYVYERGLTDRTRLTIDTLSGLKYLTLTVENGKVTGVAVDMGCPAFAAAEIPAVSEKAELVMEQLEVNGETFQFTAVSMGNPHCVIFVDELNDHLVHDLGPVIEHRTDLFPERINVEFIRVIDGHTLEMRVWERGSGETWACGTGACASVAAAVKNGLLERNREVEVRLLGGSLFITWQSSGSVLMKGPAAFVFDGELCPEA